MQKIYSFRKDIRSCTDRDVSSTERTALKRTGFFSWFTKVLPLFALLFCATGSAQPPDYPPFEWFNWKYSLEWEPVLDCAQKTVRGDEIVNDDCILACKNSTVTYFMREIYASMYVIQDIEWEVTGGSIEETYDESDLPEEQFGVQIHWDDDSAGGYIKMTITTDIAPYVWEVFVCVRLIDAPSALFEPDGGYSEFCLGSEISFDNLTTVKHTVEHYLWDFGDGNYSSEFEPTHTYASSGTYQVTLTAINKCGCESTYSMPITVTDESEFIVISCPGLVTEEGVHSYTTNDPCNEGGVWTANGGTIIGANNDSSVDIIWNNVDPLDGFGYLYYQSACGCTITAKIPVVLEEVKIEGDETMCEGDQRLYFLPQWATTYFSWSITPTTTPSSLVATDQPNVVAIDGLEPGTYTLLCEYTNTIWNYSGETFQKTITVLEKPEIIVEDIKFCSGEDTHTYTTVGGGNVCWELRKNGEIVPGGSYYGNEFSYNQFTTGGIYILTASNNEDCIDTGGCESDPLMIKVIQTPPAPEGEIEGSIFVCPGGTYQYSYENTVPGTMLVWEASGGAVIYGSNIGETVNVNFTGDGDYQVNVRRQTMSDPVCISEDKLTLTVHKINITDLAIISDDGFTFCPSSIAEFTADFGGVVPDHIEWQVYNNAGEFNFGNITDGGNSQTVEVRWNEITNNEFEGWLSLKVIYCGTTYIKTEKITLIQVPDLAILSTDDICPGDENIDITLDLDGVTEGTLFFWFEDNPVPEEQEVQNGIFNPVDGSYTYTVSNGFSNNSSISVNQTLTISLKYCQYNVSVTEVFEVFPETKINITSGYNFGICSDTEEYSHTIYSNLATGYDASAEFRWYKGETLLTDWIPIGEGLAATSYTIDESLPFNPEGAYHVKVKDTNGCIVSSNSVNVYINDCDTSAGNEECQIYTSLDVDITWEWNCEKITVMATVDPENAPDSYHWSAIGEFISLADGQGTDTATFETDIPGEYVIEVGLKYGECNVTRSVKVTKSYEPKLNIGVVCGDNGTYDITLYNSSVIFPFEGTVLYAYFRGDSIDPNNLITVTEGESVFEPGVAPGQQQSYTLALFVDGDEEGEIYPICSVTKTIDLELQDTPTFTINSNLFCVDDVIELTVDDYNPNHTYIWSFYETSYITSEEVALLNIDKAGIYGITLTVQTQYGCTLVSDEENITITEAGFAGAFTPAIIDICITGTAPAIEFVPEEEEDNDMPSGYIWMNGSEPVEGATGATFVPTEAGLYWAVLIDADGCQDSSMVSEAVPVNIRPLPVIDIWGSSSLCYGESTTIQAVVGSGVQHKWQLNGSDMSGYYGSWSSNENLLKIPVENNGSLTAGTKEYTLWVRYSDMQECLYTKTFVLEVYEMLPEYPLLYKIVSCNPYEVQVYVKLPDPYYENYYEFEWSNGKEGDSHIKVNVGGVYSVNYIDVETGCYRTSHIFVPHNPEHYMWIIPSGCFDICPWDYPQPYISAPLGTYDYHEWLVNDSVAQSGTNEEIEFITIDQTGTYQLMIEAEAFPTNCFYESKIAYISPSSETLDDCDIDPCSGLDITINSVNLRSSGVYFISGTINNTSASPVTVTFSSFNGYGMYNPAGITIAPGSHLLGSFSLKFLPNPNFTGGSDYMVVSIADVPCVTLIPVTFPPNPNTGSKMMSEDASPSEDAFLRVTPNPAGAMAAVSYGLGTEYQKAESLKIYTMLGTLVAAIDLKTNSGDLPLDISRFPSGTYIISLQADGKTVLHQKLVKK